MKKIKLILVFSIAFSFCDAQKISHNNYKNVDTVYQYDDATVVIYKDKSGKIKRDVILFKNRKKRVTIESVDECNIMEGKYKDRVIITTVNQTGGQTAEIIINNSTPTP